MKKELLEQLKIEAMDEKAVKIYGGGGLKYQVSDKELVMDLPEKHRQNREVLTKVVADKVNELEAQFKSRDE